MFYDPQQPELIYQMVGQYAIRYNVHEGLSPDNESRWQYDEVIVKDLRYETVVSALIHTAYSFDAEIAVINNHINDDEQIEPCLHPGGKALYRLKRLH